MTAKAPNIGDSVPTYHKIDQDNALFMNSWGGKTVCTYGDSITEQNRWQPKLDSILGFASMDNQGLGGTMLSGGWASNMPMDIRINAIPHSDLILIMGGANDWGNDVALGSNGRANIINVTNNDISTGKQISWTNGDVESFAGSVASEFYFPVTDGVTYTFENIKNYAFYNSGKARLDGGTWSTNDKRDVVATSGSGTVRWLRISFMEDRIGAPCVYVKDIEDTLKPALSIIVSKLRFLQPSSTIVVMGTTFCKNSNKTGGSSPFADMYGLENNIGLTTTDYSDALREQSSYLGLPFIDTSSVSGWGDENVHLYTADDGANVHPNDAGAIRMANGIAGALLNINPRV